MSWASGTYTKWNSGTGGWAGDAGSGVGIEAGRHDTQDNDFQNGINNCIAKDGQNTPTANLSMGGYKHTNVANGSARNDYASLGQVQDGAVIWCGTSGGSANAQTLTPTPAITAYVAGQVFRFVAGFTSTSTLTLQVSGIAGPKTCLLKSSLSQFSNANYLVTGIVYEALYDGTNFLISDLLELGNFTNDGASARLKLFKSRGTTAGSNVIVQPGDGLGQIDFYGANGTGYTRGAYIGAFVDATPGPTNDMPTSVVIATAADGGSVTAERMRVTNSGNVGVNTTDPRARLTVSGVTPAITGFATNPGTIQLNEEGITNLATNGGLEFQGSDTSSGYGSKIVGFDDGALVFANRAFSATWTERARIDNTGRVLIGTNTTAGTANTLMYLKNNATGTTWQTGPHASTGNSFYVINSSDIGVRLDSGNTSWSANSDFRLKKNIQDLNEGLENICNLRPVRFDYLSEESDLSARVGFIAQEVQPHIPEAVTGSEETYFSISPTELIPALVNAIKQLNNKIDFLDAKVAVLENA